MPAKSLAQLVAEVEAEIQYAPELAAHHADIRTVINRQFEELARSSAWPWLTREYPLQVFPDFSVPNDEVALWSDGGFGGVPKSNRAMVIFTSSILDKMYATEDNTGAYSTLQTALLGADFGLEDMTLRAVGDGNWAQGPFTIEALEPSSTAFLFWLDPRAKIIDITDEEGPWRFSFPRWLLQGDVDEVVEVTDSRGRKLAPMQVDEYRRRLLQSSMPQAGTPQAFVRDGGEDVRFAPLQANVAQLTTEDRSMISYQRENAHIRKPITIVEEASGGADYMVVGQTYRFFVCWMYSNRYGPASNIVEYTPTTGFTRAVLEDLPELAESSFVTVSPNADRGWRLAVFGSDSRTGAFYLWDQFDAPTAGNEPLLLANPIFGTSPEKQTRWDESVPSVYQYLRLWPRPATHERLTVRYLARPPQLVNENDTPNPLHESFHAWLMWAACADMSSRFAGEAFHSRCRQNAGRIHERMLNYYQPGQREIPQKGMIGSRGRGYPPLSVTYGGP